MLIIDLWPEAFSEPGEADDVDEPVDAVYLTADELKASAAN